MQLRQDIITGMQMLHWDSVKTAAMAARDKHFSGAASCAYLKLLQPTAGAPGSGQGPCQIIRAHPQGLQLWKASLTPPRCRQRPLELVVRQRQCLQGLQGNVVVAPGGRKGARDVIDAQLEADQHGEGSIAAPGGRQRGRQAVVRQVQRLHKPHNTGQVI